MRDVIIKLNFKSGRFTVIEPSRVLCKTKELKRKKGRPKKTSPLQEAEKKEIIRALEQCMGHRSRAAELLGMGERTIYRKIREYGIKIK